MTISHPSDHDFRPEAWWARRDCERQRQLRAIAPMSFGSVLIARDDMDEQTIRWHLQQMKALGFNSIKQFMDCPRWPTAQLERMALEEGLCPWWYGEGGWEAISDDLCTRLGIDPGLPMAAKRRHPAMLDHQHGVWERRIGRERIKLNPEQQAGFNAGNEQAERRSAKELGADASLPAWAVPHFIAWLKETYGDLDGLNAAWNTDVMRGTLKAPFTDWDQLIEHNWVEPAREYGRVRDLLRFKAAFKAHDVAATCAAATERDPFEPGRVGGEMGIFLPFASRGTDMELLADAVKESGSFYPSIHLCWHFEETWFEVARPVYMQATMVVDWNKGGWTAPWESTGGPQQTSGAKAMLFPWVADQQPGFTVTGGTMAQLLLSYLAAGCKGAGLWSWNARQAGFEGGEYALVDRNEQVGERARRAGAIAAAAEGLRDELWQALREPQVGILVDFDNEAIWAAMSQRMRTIFKYRGVEGRIGADRACIDACLTLEHVTGHDLRSGLASRYPIIYMPAVLGLNRAHLKTLIEYVEQGGRLVIDMPGGSMDETGRMLRTLPGSDFERLFGCAFSDLQYSGNNVQWHLQGRPLEGYTAELTPTTGSVTATYDNGMPAVIEHTLGKGSAVILGWEAARACYRPGNTWFQERLVAELLGGAEPFYKAEGQPMAYRLAAPAADHYFLVNQGPASATVFTRLPYDYASATDAVSGAAIDLAAPIPVAADDGRWIRAVK